MKMLNKLTTYFKDLKQAWVGDCCHEPNIVIAEEAFPEKLLYKISKDLPFVDSVKKDGKTTYITFKGVREEYRYWNAYGESFYKEACINCNSCLGWRSSSDMIATKLIELFKSKNNPEEYLKLRLEEIYNLYLERQNNQDKAKLICGDL